MADFKLSLFLLAFMVFATPATAFWRLLCKGQLAVARMDPLINFGQISPHAHAVHGASNFGFAATNDDLLASKCTSCSIRQDRSAYWTPALYFKDNNGSFTLVPQVGGMTIYYFTNNTGDEKITAFPKGFRMIAGDTSMRNTTLPQPEPEMSFWTGSELTQFGLAQKSIGFNCLHYQVAPNEGSLEHHYMRDKAFLDANCFDGLRFELMFPSCWDGKNIDSPNHKDHILYPELRKTGACPDGFPVKMPQLFYETIYDTYSFRNESGTFILANGDPTGYGYHGDFMAGWDPDFLQHTIDTCRNDSGLQEDCHLFDLQDDANATSCTLPLPEELLHEDYPGPREGLPGNILIQSGPEYAQEFPGTPLSAVSSLPSSEPSPANHSNVATTSNSTPSKSSSSSIATTSASTCETPPPPAIAAPPSVSLVYSTITSNSAIVDLVIVEEEVTVTVTTSALETGDMLRRHLGKHQHHHHQQRH